MHVPKLGGVASSSWGLTAVLTPDPKSPCMPQSLEGSPTAGSMSGRLSFASALMLLKAGCCTANMFRSSLRSPREFLVTRADCKMHFVWKTRPGVCSLITHIFGIALGMTIFMSMVIPAYYLSSALDRIIVKHQLGRARPQAMRIMCILLQSWVHVPLSTKETQRKRAMITGNTWAQSIHCHC